MNLSCDKSLIIIIILVLLLFVLGSILFYRMKNDKLEDCGCDNNN